MSKINHYDVLGVPRDCEQQLIDTVYKSMVRIFHPDVFKGDKVFAHEKLKVVNEAYSVLGDAELRKAYDDDLRRSESSGATEEIYEDERSDHQPFDEMYKEEWKVIVGYFPEIDDFYKSLRKINANLSMSFKLEIISKKNYRLADTLFQNMKLKFFNEKFGKNLNVHSLVMCAIDNGNRKFALELNRDLSILGESEYVVVLLNLFEKHKEFCTEFYPRYGFERLLESKKSMGMQVGSYRIGRKLFLIDPDCVLFSKMIFRITWRFEKFTSVEDMISSGKITVAEVRAAKRSF
jgi:curved DNA-binding protein CbpA